MAARAIWKGVLKLAELVCPVALHTAASTSERVAFHTLNRATGHRVRREFVDSDTGRPVAREDQVKGYEVTDGDYLVLSADDLAMALPESDKTLAVSAFVRCDQIDQVYLDKPYFLAPADRTAEEPFGLIREGMRTGGVAAIATAVLFRRARTVAIHAQNAGLIATLLHTDYEVRPAAEAFHDIAPQKITGEMLDLAQHIIKTKMGQFDPGQFDDRYEVALAELVKAKIDGRKPAPRRAATDGKVVDLLAALRESAGRGRKPLVPKPSPSAGRTPSKPRRKAS